MKLFLKVTDSQEHLKTLWRHQSSLTELQKSEPAGPDMKTAPWNERKT